MVTNIASERKRAGITQDELGEILGVGGRAVRNWETGICKPPIKRVVEMADYFGCSTDYLLCRTDARLPALIG